MIKKVLIANRGEIALRIIRACKELGIETVAVHSTVDAEALHVRFADHAICIGPAHSRDSYLNVPAILSAAEVSGADSIHPGYGFLSENAEFAEVVKSCGLHWIGPKPEIIRMMGNKVRAREVAASSGLPLLPGSKAALKDANEAVEMAMKIGFPVILKAAAGGGGRGMKIVRDPALVAQAFNTASAEAVSAFGDGSMYIERYIDQPRHIEIQILADEYGNVVHLGERECSVQRRHQKLIEEAPSPALTQKIRDRMGKAAVDAMKKIGYNNVGTVEFLLDEKGDFFFMEMNTRIQVEHPITELVTGIDLVKEQIRLSGGEKLRWSQKDIQMNGHAIEFRINAEDAVTFAPSPGTITGFHVPGGIGVRFDSAAYEQYKVQPHYDSLLAKLIVYGKDREEAIARGRRALDEMVVEGIRTNTAFHQKVLAWSEFIEGKYDTRIVERIQQGVLRRGIESTP